MYQGGEQEGFVILTLYTTETAFEYLICTL